ncbi:hypothetical protein OJ252_3737, partial [Cryptosporidium canis]
AEFDLGRPVTSPSTPIIEPKYYIAKEGEEGGGISVSPALPLSFEEKTETEAETGAGTGIKTGAGTWTVAWAVTGARTGAETETEAKTETEHSKSSSSFLISCELVKMEREDSKDGSCQMILVASVTQKPILIYRLEPGTSNEHSGLEDLIFSSKWKLQILTNLDQALADISKFFVQGRFSVVRLEETGASSCIAKIDSPWSPLHLLLTTSRRSEINFEFLNLPFSSLDPRLCYSLSPIPLPGGDNWFLRRAILPEVLIQRVAYCKEHDLVAVIVGLPDNVKHHLNGYHIRQMALYRYFRCLEAGGKEAQAIISNQDLVRNPEECFEMSLSRIPDLGIPPADFASETYFDTLPPGIEIGETMPKIFHQSNLINGKAAKSGHNGRFAFGAWEVGLSMRFGKDSKGQQILIVGTGTNPTHYYEAEGRLLIFKVKQLDFLNDE